MAKYRVIVHRETERRAAVVEEETPKFKVLTLHFLDDDKEQQYSSSTIKRYWKKTDEFVEIEDTTAVVMEQKKELGIKVTPIDPQKVEILQEDVAGDGTSYKQVMQEILHDENLAVKKKAAKKVKRSVFDSTALQEYAIEVLNSLGGDYVQRKQDKGAKDMAQKAFRAGGKMFMHMCYPRYNLYFNTRGVDTEKFVPDAELTGFYTVRYIFTEDTKQTRVKIKQLITQAYKAQLAKNSKKGKGDK